MTKVLFSFRMDTDLREKIKVIANEKRVTSSSIVQTAILNFLKNQEKLLIVLPTTEQIEEQRKKNEAASASLDKLNQEVNDKLDRGETV